MNDETPHYVYRCYDAEGLLLYIGCTYDVVTRMQVHMCSLDNPASVVLARRMERYEVEEFPTFEEARAAERAAIAAEAPLANLHHQRERVTPAERARRLDQYIERTRPPVDPEFAAWLADDLKRLLDKLAEVTS